MNSLVSGLFNSHDSAQLKSLDLRSQRSELIKANIANSETPGYRAVGIDFEKAMQQMTDSSQIQLKTNSNLHLTSANLKADGLSLIHI